jgi:hypothetical protein
MLGLSYAQLVVVLALLKKLDLFVLVNVHGASDFLLVINQHCLFEGISDCFVVRKQLL